MRPISVDTCKERARRYLDYLQKEDDFSNGDITTKPVKENYNLPNRVSTMCRVLRNQELVNKFIEDYLNNL